MDPYGIVADHFSGNIYVSEMGDDCIKIFDSSGNWLSQFGHYGYGLGEFKNPYGITTDLDGSVYLSDGNGYGENISRVYKFDSANNLIRSIGSEGSGDGQFGHTTWFTPFGVATDPQGNLYVADTVNYRIQKFDSSGNF